MKSLNLLAAAAVISMAGACSAQQDQTGNSGGANTGSGMQQGAMDASHMKTGMQADQQIMQQLQSIAQEPKWAPDRLFVLNTAIGNMAEVKLAEFAWQNSKNDQVKQVAGQIVKDHEQATKQLQQVAQSAKVTLPQELPSMKQQELAIKMSLPQDQFDKAFICHMQSEHAKDVTEYRSVAQTAMNKDVKQFAAQTLPKLQQHAQMVQQVAVAMGLPSGDITGEARPASERMGGDNSNDRTNGGQTGGNGNGSGGGTTDGAGK